MKAVKKRLKRTVLAWCVLCAVLLVFGVLIYRGVLWFNMPSRLQYPVRGVDISHYQGTVDFATIAAQDVQFVFLKATEGSGSVDECFSTNWENARNSGICVGAYHFFSFDSAAETQADNFCALVPNEADALPPVIDLEFYRSKDLPEDETVKRNLAVLVSRFTEFYGRKPIIYTTDKCWKRYLEDADFDYTLWIRSVYSPPFDYYKPEWRFWQYNSRGRLEGYEGDESFIDLNVYRGSWNDFQMEFFRKK